MGERLEKLKAMLKKAVSYTHLHFYYFFIAHQ